MESVNSTHGAAFANVLLCVATIFIKGLVIEIQNPIGI